MSTPTFPTDDAHIALLLGRIDPIKYAKTRNFLTGEVTCLSPYLTHGYLGLSQCTHTIADRTPLSTDDKLIFEFAWREYFQRCWQALGMQGLWLERHAPPSAAAYASSMPNDIVQGCTGVPAIDQAVRQLYQTGYLHNHARMWLASYVVHLRKVSWRVGAAWLYAHLLDGDLASNTLSWQWVAGTWTGKPYLFNAENVAKYAPSAWHSPTTVIDQGYEALNALACSAADVGAEYTAAQLEAAPHAVPLAVKTSLSLADLAQLMQAPIEWVHPWHLAQTTAANRRPVGLIIREFHADYPWANMRWQWVMQRMRALCGDTIAVLSMAEVAQLAATQADTRQPHSTVATMNPYYAQALAQLGNCREQDFFLAAPTRFHPSFSSFFQPYRQKPLHFNPRQARLL